jgi:hypothetical protein
VLGPINEVLKTEQMQGVVFEDNLTSHKTEAVMEFWDSCPSLSEFIPPRFVPPNLTDIVQVRRSTLFILLCATLVSIHLTLYFVHVTGN